MVNVENAKEFAMDPSMFRSSKVTCPECGYREAVYCLSNDDEAKKLRLVYVCARVEDNSAVCARIWYSDQTQDYEDSVC